MPRKPHPTDRYAHPAPRNGVCNLRPEGAARKHQDTDESPETSGLRVKFLQLHAVRAKPSGALNPGVGDCPEIRRPTMP